jgi:hypothetical protein
MILNILKGDTKSVPSGGVGLTGELHPCFFRGMSCLATITGNAGTYHILPDMLATSITGGDMV